MSAYYNEHDPFAAAWLRELIADGLIAPGEVDERSIEDVTPDDLRPFRQCHFFAGIGVWSLAARFVGIDDDTPLWTGSCPCQPFSAAGKGAGFADERHLWPAFHFLIEQSRPDVVAGEQVAGNDGDVWLDLVSADMEATGYAFGAAETVACGFGAPHKRSRNYWVALADFAGSQRLAAAWSARSGRQRRAVSFNGAPLLVADTQDGDGRCGERRAEEGVGTGELGRRGLAGGGAAVELADRERAGLERLGGHGDDGHEPGRVGAVASRSTSSGGELGGMADALDDGFGQHGGRLGQASREGERGPREREWVWPYLANGGANGLGHNRRPGPVNGFWRDADWLRCRDEKWRAVEPETFPLADAGTFRNRVGLLRGAGNAITIGQAAGFLQAVMASLR